MKEYSNVQNPALGALALFNFVKSYSEVSEKANIKFPLIFVLLPVVFNERCLLSISDVKRVTGKISMLNVLAEHRDIPVGLQSRMVQMSGQTLKSLNIAFAKRLIGWDRENKELFPYKYLRIPNSVSDTNQRIFHASRIMGKWFAHNTIEQICISLNLSFTNEF